MVIVLEAAVSSFAIALVLRVSCQAARLSDKEATIAGLSCAKNPKALCRAVWHSGWAHLYMYLVLFELLMKRTAVWPSGHMAGKAGFVLGVPRGGPFFGGGVQGGAGGGMSFSGGALVVGFSSSGSLAFGAL